MTVLGTLRSAAKHVINDAQSRRVDHVHAQQAMRAVRLIEKCNGQTLTGRLKRSVDDYSEQVFGSRRYAPWLYVYALVRGGFKEGWIPDNFFERVVSPSVNKSLRVATDFKSFTNVILHTDALPDIAYYIDGVIYNRDLSVINFDALRAVIGRTRGDVYVKKDNSNRGRGVAMISYDDFSAQRLATIGNCVIQSAIKQHEWFDRIVTGSVATIRMTTVKDCDGSIALRASYLRLGRKDTAWVQSGNSVRVAVVGKFGELDDFGYTQDWRRHPSHPDTQFSFHGECVPRFIAMRDTCVALHAKVPHLTIIGWDVTVDTDELVRVIEWNGVHCDIKFSEATTGPCFIGLNWEHLRE